MGDIIVKVRVSKTGQKIVTIPKKELIEQDDYVVIKKLGGLNGEEKN